ncbi:putative bifunctional diguanylate cyclase/phosphodiesterase [Citreimonas salinaria]|uniref:PAS domain S-box-containing protein/diguanylate cyclase (GGDEF) domain-containing protein n=1 Tax=Citreimonas salinaria TaxID=321339 RepID=A0A1H3HXF2_9RHOB|nr:EAL domain-containing protein [Citreimonas salinaria]SDY19528.1 PAS domain S-box-containing protein/diguanylate cyclase (GGDEF) domain-containing protein [Citreimonas salinaria]
MKRPDGTELSNVPDDRARQPEGEPFWETAVLSANQAVWDHDFELNRHHLSKTWRDLRGMSADDHIHTNTEAWLKTVHEHDVAHIVEEWQRIDSGETDVINYKFRQRHKDGHWVWFLSRGRVVRRNAEGLPVRIVGTDTDITDIKTVELESQRMAQRLDVAMGAAGMGRWELNVETGQAYWDDRMLQMLAIKDGIHNRPGDDWLQFVHPDDRAEIYPYLSDCVAKRQDIARDYRVLTAERETIHIRARAKYVDDLGSGPHYYGVNFDITRDKLQAEELERARALLEHESRHDALTGLANRRKLDEVYLENARHNSGAVAVLHFDIDHFKQINDTLGHNAGDATLRHAADVLMRKAPDKALVSRVGGDEFVVLLFDAPDDQALQLVAEDFILEMSRPFHYGAQKCSIGTSIGIARCASPRDFDENLFINADLALYEAKKAGRGRYRFYSSSMKEEARRRKRSFDALTAGVEKGEITCHYQPQFDAVTLEVSGLEALVRWESEKFGLMMPQEFLPVAEDMGILPEFDDLVLRRALHDIRTWHNAGLHVPPVSVNVSATRLKDPMLGEQLGTLDLPPGILSFELLESTFLDARNEVIEKNLAAINALGISIEIDDFGSGHASIASLLEIAPARLKIDRALIRPIVDSERQRELVRTIIGIGHMLGIRVVAEGVETDPHIQILQEMNCCFLQGFGLARPMDSANVAHFLSRAAPSARAGREA